MIKLVFVLVFIFIVIPRNLFAQTKEQLLRENAIANQQIKQLKHKIDSIEHRINSIEKKITDYNMKELESKGLHISCTVSKETYITEEPPPSTKKILDVKRGDVVQLVDIMKDGSLYIVFDSKKGYLLKTEIEMTPEFEKAYDIIQKKYKQSDSLTSQNKLTSDSLVLVSILETFKDSIAVNVKCEIDDFTGKITYRSPIFQNGKRCSMVIYKIIEGEKESYYLSLRTKGNIPIVDGRNIIVLFDNGDKLSKSIPIDVSVDSDGYEYSAYVPITMNDLNTFLSKMVKKFRLYIFDESVDAMEADNFRRYVKCLRLAK